MTAAAVVGDDPIERYAELQRLARVLGIAPQRLSMLAGAAPADLRELRAAIADELMESQRDGFERVVTLARMLPDSLCARLAQHAMGPALAARATTLLDPAQAAQLAQRLEPRFLADVAEHLDLRRIGPLLGGIPTATLTAVALELRRRERWIVLGTFVGYLRLPRVRSLLEVFDGEVILRSGIFVESPQRIDAIARLLSDDRLDGLLGAAHRHDLWPEAVWLLGRLGPDQRTRVYAALGRLDAAALARLSDLLLTRDELRAAARPLIRRAPRDLRRRIGV